MYSYLSNTTDRVAAQLFHFVQHQLIFKDYYQPEIIYIHVRIKTHIYIQIHVVCNLKTPLSIVGMLLGKAFGPHVLVYPSLNHARYFVFF